MSELTKAVLTVKAAKNLDLNFEDLTNQFWSWDNSDYVLYSDDKTDVEEETGDGYSLEVRYKQDEDDNYIRLYVDNGCGDKYDVVFAKANRVEVE